MHSNAIVSSLLMVAAVAYAAPAAPSGSSSYTTPYGGMPSAASYTQDSTLEASATASASYVPDAKITSSASAYASSSAVSSAKASPSAKFSGDVVSDSIPAVINYNTRAKDQDLIAALLSAPTQSERSRLLSQPGDVVFDFNVPGEGGETNGQGGRTVAANAKTFPALLGLDSAMTLGFIGPCGINTPHVHPRATELNIIVEGRLVTNFIGENGVAPTENVLSKYQMTVFPQGAIHTEFNPDCEDAVFVAGFDHNDPGVSQIAQNFFGLRGDIVSSSLRGASSMSGSDIESFRDLIPANVAMGVDACLAKCGLKKNAKRDIEELF